MATTRRRQGRRVFRAMLGLSLLIHAAVFGGPAAVRRLRPPPDRPPELARSARLADRVAEAGLAAARYEARRELVARARADREAGRLRLGEFLLEANAIDAREEGRAFDLPRARESWAGRLERMRAAAGSKGRDVRRAVPEAFGDLHYYGRPGRSMGDALLEGGGACEALTHLIVAAVHDVGRPALARFRYYGGGSEGGATHVAPVYEDAAGETDLLTGGAARRTGALIAAADLVDAYARARGIDPVPPSPGREGGGEEPEKRSSSLVDGYPPNDDRYPGAVPLYAEHAIHAEGQASAPAAAAPAAHGSDCAFFLRKAVLDPPALLVSGPGVEPGAFGGFPVELRRLPTSTRLDRTFAVVENVERSLLPGNAPADPAEHLVALACLASLYDAAASDLALSSEHQLARLALEKRRKAAEEGKRLLAGVDWAGPEGRALLARLSGRFAGRSWLLLVLPGGDVPVLRMAAEAGDEGWGRTDALAALLVAPATRGAALDLVRALPLRAQIDVMHEVFHAHDHQRPWASSYALEGAGDGDFARAYRVFRGLAWGLWEAARPDEESLAALIRGAAAERLDRAWVAGLVEYYCRNALALHLARSDGPDVARTLARWLEDRGFTDVDAYAAALAAARHEGGGGWNPP